MNIPEHILQQVADEAFLSSNGGMMGLLTCNKEKNHVFWHEERYERRTIIQHAITNPALAPFMAGTEPTPPAKAEQLPAMAEPLTLIGGVPFDQSSQVPLGPEDYPPGSVLRFADQHWYNALYVSREVICLVSGDSVAWKDWNKLQDDGWQINTSIPDTGRWDKDAWRPCSKPGKEVESEHT